MKKREILFHYISFSLFISLAGVIIGGLLGGKDYFIAGFFVLVISVLVSFLFSGRIKKLDMIEVLKGVE